MPLTIAAWIFIFLAALSLLTMRWRTLGLSLLAVGYLLALLEGLIDWRASIPVLLLATSGYAVSAKHSRAWRTAGHVVFAAVAVALGFHLLPGFHNLQVIGPVRLTADAVPFTMYLNLDKPLGGFWVLLLWPALRLHRGVWSWLQGLGVGFVTAVVWLGLVVALGAANLEPKWPEFAWIWVLNNLLLVAFTEETLFRGYLQEAMVRRFGERRDGEFLAIGVAAILFGLAHVGGGAGYVLVAGLAGVGYGFAYRLGGLQAAVMAHFALNLVHFSLFTYPMLAN